MIIFASYFHLSGKTSNHADVTFVLVCAKHVFLHLAKHLLLHYDAVVANFAFINLNLDIACSHTASLIILQSSEPLYKTPFFFLQV